MTNEETLEISKTDRVSLADEQAGELSRTDESKPEVVVVTGASAGVGRATVPGERANVNRQDVKISQIVLNSAPF